MIANNALAAPSRHRLALFAQQFSLLKTLEARGIPGVIRAYDLLPTVGVHGATSGSLILVCEYFPGPSLQSYMNSRLFSRGFGVLELLKLGISISHTLGQIHSENILHKDITSSNILYDRSRQEVKLIDFGLSGMGNNNSSSYIQGAAAATAAAGAGGGGNGTGGGKKNTALQGTLNYLSPEATGRVQRPVDYRSDLYSLGVVLYQVCFCSLFSAQ